MQTTSLNAADVSKAFGRARFSPEFVKYHQLGHFLPQTSRWFLFVTRRKSLKDLPLPLPRGLFCRLLSPGGAKEVTAENDDCSQQHYQTQQTQNCKHKSKTKSVSHHSSFENDGDDNERVLGQITFTRKKTDQRIMRSIIWKHEIITTGHIQYHHNHEIFCLESMDYLMSYCDVVKFANGVETKQPGY